MTQCKRFLLISNILQVLKHHVWVSYPSISRLVHVALNFSGISNKILHPSIFQCSWIRSRKYGLYTAVTYAQQWNNNHSTMKIISPSNLFVPIQRKGRADSQLMDKMIAEILCDIFMPRLPYACSRRRCRGHGSHACHTITEQAEERDNQWGKRDEANIVLILTPRGDKVMFFTLD